MEPAGRPLVLQLPTTACSLRAQRLEGGMRPAQAGAHQRLVLLRVPGREEVGVDGQHRSCSGRARTLCINAAAQLGPQPRLHACTN